MSATLIRGTIEAVPVSGWDNRALSEVPERTRVLMETKMDQIKELMEMSQESWLIRAAGTPLCFLSATRLRPLSADWYMWLVPFKGLKAFYLPDLKRMFEEHAPRGRMVAQIIRGDRVGARFAEFFGFKFISEKDEFDLYVRNM